MGDQMPRLHFSEPGLWPADLPDLPPLSSQKEGYLMKQVEFRGPCKSRIALFIYGTIFASAHYSALGNSPTWDFIVNRMCLYTVAPLLRAALLIGLVVNQEKLLAPPEQRLCNSAAWRHTTAHKCKSVKLHCLKLVAPAESPNADGIRIMPSSAVTITASDIRTGDDCISIGPGTSNLWMEQLRCGPGHGIR